MTAVRTRKRPFSGASLPQTADATALHRAIIELKIVQCAPAELSPPPRACRKHTKRQLRTIEASITEYGVIKPLLIDPGKQIIAGYGVWMAARALGLATVPVISIDHLTPEQIRVYRLTDNQSATLGCWDDDLLRLELGELYDLSLDTQLDVELTGFTTAEMDAILLGAGKVEEREEDEQPEEGPAVSQAGDLWILGMHRLYCGNSLDESSYIALLGQERAQMVVGDIPYNVPVNGHVSSRPGAREFSFASGEMSPDEFIAFQRTIFGHLARYSIEGSIHYQFIDWRHVWEMTSAGREEYTELKNILVWSKTNASRGFYRSQHELICVFKSGDADHICSFGLEKGARVRSNVITMAGCNSFGKTRDEDLAAHVTVKPTSLIADLMRDCSKRNGIVLDPFGGSGTTILAAEWTQRRARLIEIDPLYVDVAIRRWEKRTGKQAVLDGSDLTFADVAAERDNSSDDGEEIDG